MAANLSGVVDLRGVDFTGCDLTQTLIAGCNFSNAKLHKAQIESQHDQ